MRKRELPILGKRYKVVKLYKKHDLVMWINQMNKYIGKIATITYVNEERGNGWVKIDLDEGNWCWDVNSFEEYEEDWLTDKDFEIL